MTKRRKQRSIQPEPPPLSTADGTGPDEWFFSSAIPYVVGLHEVYECGPTESYPEVPTIHYAWCPYTTQETRYPIAVHESTTDRCTSTGHWRGGLTKKYSYLAFGGDATDSIYDELNHVVVDYGYNTLRDRTSIRDASGNTIYYDYRPDKIDEDGLHNPYFRRDSLGNEWAYTYYPDHRLHTETDAYGRNVATYTYNSYGQLTRIDTPVATPQLVNDYDQYKRLDYSTDARGKTTYYHYNEEGENRGFLTSVHDPGDKATLYHYDSKGRRDRVTDPNGNITRYVYDDLDRITKVIYGPNDTDPYTETRYTCCHEVYTQDENGRRTYYVYDAKNRLYKVIASAKSTTLAHTGLTSESPGEGEWLSLNSVADLPVPGEIVVLDEIIRYDQKDAANRVRVAERGAEGTRRVNPIINGSVYQEVAFGDPVGRVDTMQATYGYHPQYLDWMISLTDAMNHTTYYEYYENGKQKTIRYPDNTGERYTYDNNNSGNNMTKKEYGTFGTYPDQTFTPNNDLTVNYEYDANNQLLRSYH